MKEILPASKNGKWEYANNSVVVSNEILQSDEYTISLVVKPEFEKSAQGMPNNDALVVLDLALSPELIAEGYARDVVRAVQQARKDADLSISEHILLTLETAPQIQAQLKPHLAFIGEQVLAGEVTFGKASTDAASIELDGEKLLLSIQRAQA